MVFAVSTLKKRKRKIQEVEGGEVVQMKKKMMKKRETKETCWEQRIRETVPVRKRVIGVVLKAIEVGLKEIQKVQRMQKKEKRKGTEKAMEKEELWREI